VQLEQSLTVLVHEFEEEKKSQEQSYADRHTHLEAELQSLQRRCQLQDREAVHVKKLARRILEKRSELEEFFMEALAHVKKEIETNRWEVSKISRSCYVHITLLFKYPIVILVMFVFNKNKIFKSLF